MGKAVVESEAQKLRREKNFLMQEVMQLRMEQLTAVKKMDSINHRIQAAELRQKQMASFLAKLLQNPTFISHLKELKGGRGKRKFIEYHQQPVFGPSDEPMNQQDVFEHNEGNPIPKFLLKDFADKSDLDTGGEVFGGSDESEDRKGKNIVRYQECQMESEFPGSDCLLSLPNDIAYISEEAMFPEAIGLEVGESLLSSEPAVWDDSLGREMEIPVGSLSLWDLGLNALEEDLDIANYVGGESSLQEHKDDGGRPNADCSENLEP